MTYINMYDFINATVFSTIEKVSFTLKIKEIQLVNTKLLNIKMKF